MPDEPSSAIALFVLMALNIIWLVLGVIGGVTVASWIAG
jgi:hypothetical protein